MGLSFNSFSILSGFTLDELETMRAKVTKFGDDVGYLSALAMRACVPLEMGLYRNTEWTDTPLDLRRQTMERLYEFALNNKDIRKEKHYDVKAGIVWQYMRFMEETYV